MSRTKTPLITLCYLSLLLLLGGTLACSSRTRIAVLPYDNYSARPEDHWLRDGLSESLSDHLQYVKQFEILPRDRINEVCTKLETTPYVDWDEKKAGKIGRKLKAKYVVMGRFRRSNGSLVVFSRIVKPFGSKVVHEYRQRTESPKNYRFFSQILNIAEYTAFALGGSGDMRMAMKPASLRTRTFKAYEYYILGRLSSFHNRAEDYRVAIRWYRQAINADYRYSLAYAGIADAYVRWGFLLKQKNKPYQEEYRKAHQNLKKAQKYDIKIPDFHTGKTKAILEADIHYIVGETHLRNENYEAAVASFRKNLELTPEDSYTLFFMGEAYLGLGDTERARNYYTSALEKNPALIKAIDRLEDLTDVEKKSEFL